MTNKILEKPRLEAGLICALHLSSLLFVGMGLAAMFLLSPKVLYADPWRFTAHFMSSQWPWNVLEADNGHREVLPNVIRVIELYWLDGNQWLQILIGAVLACATVVALSLIIYSENRTRLTKAAALFFAVAGIFWLGNIRSLAHANESVHAYLVTLFLVAGAWMVSKPDSDRSLTRLLCVVGLGILATFSFGAGIACFVGYAAILVLRRARLRSLILIASGAIFALALHFSLGGTAVTSAAGGSLVQMTEQTLRWLSAPFIYIAWPLLDSNVSGQIPVHFVRAPMTGMAETFEHLFGPVMLARWPNMLIGAAGLGWLLASSHAYWRTREESRAAMLGLGISWFALAVGVMVAITRSGYFLQYPEQVVAPRYLPWSSLFWSGLAMAATIRNGSSRILRQATFALLTAALLMPSQAWMAMLAYRTQSVASLTAIGAAVGAIGEHTELGETVFAEMASARPALSAKKKSVFAWAETQALGKVFSGTLEMPVTALDVQTVNNRFGGHGAAVSFELASSPCPRLALIDKDGVIVGLSMRRGWSKQWHGWARATSNNPLRVVALCEYPGNSR